jgi:hypothetical protein
LNAAQRPDLNPLPGGSTNAVNPRNTTNYINSQCFFIPQAGEIGNLGRNTLRAPGFQTFDPSLSKIWTVHDRTGVQFRGEIFNAFNQANFQDGVTLCCSTAKTT